MKKCEICGNRIGIFDKYYTSLSERKICVNCVNYAQKDPNFKHIYGIFSEKDVAWYMNNEVGDNYLHKINHQTQTEFREQHAKEEKDRILAEKERLAEKEKDDLVVIGNGKHILIKEEERDRILAEKERLAEETRLKRIRQKIYHFKVRGATFYDIKKLVNFARKNNLFNPYSGWTAKDIKEFAPYTKWYETNIEGLIDTIEFIPEPDNEYDPNAIQVIATIKDKTFNLGHVPANSTKDIFKILDDNSNGKIKLRIEYELTGGKYKLAEENEYDFSYDPKLKIHSGTDDYGFNVRLFDENIQ